MRLPDRESNDATVQSVTAVMYPSDPEYKCFLVGVGHPHISSCNTLLFSAAVLLLRGGHTDGLAQRSDEGRQTDEVAVFPAPLGPRDVVSELEPVRQRGRLPKVYHPHAGLAAVVVDKEERAANHLIRSNR